MQNLLNSWWMNSLKIHAPILMLELAAVFLLSQAAAALLQKVLPWDNARLKSQWRPLGAAVNTLAGGLAVMLALHNSLGAIAHQRQLQALLGALQSGAQAVSGAPQAAAAGSAAQPTEEQKKQQEAANQAKAAFLNQMANYLEKPEIVDVTKIRAELEKTYPGLLGDQGKDIRATYLKAITTVYQCDREFQEDIARTIKSKRVEKSAARAKCEATSGEFFLRPLLIPEEQAKAQQQALEALANGDKVGETPVTIETAKRGSELARARMELAGKVLR